MFSFRLFLEEYTDVFGFDDDKLNVHIASLRHQDDKPIQPFRIHEMMTGLSTNRIGNLTGNQRFANSVQWGVNAGAIRVDVLPQKMAHIERLISDFEGTPTWTTKKIFKINEDEFKGYEDTVATAIFEQASQIYAEPLDNPAKHYVLTELVYAIHDRLRDGFSSEVFILDGVRKVNENQYIITFWLRGGGQGALLRRKADSQVYQTNLNVSFNENRGLIHAFIEFLETGDRGVSWEIQPAIFEAWYCPNQKAREIAETIVTFMRYF